MTDTITISDSFKDDIMEIAVSIRFAWIYGRPVVNSVRVDALRQAAERHERRIADIHHAVAVAYTFITLKEFPRIDAEIQIREVKLRLLTLADAPQ